MPRAPITNTNNGVAAAHLSNRSRHDLSRGIVPFYEQEVVKVFRELGVTNHRSAPSAPPRAEAPNRVKGRPKPGASGPLTRRRVQYAGVSWRARSPVCKPFWSHIYQRQRLLQSRSASLCSEAGHRARETPVSHSPSIRWRMASLILYARYAGIFPGQCPISKIGYVGNPGTQRACSLQTVNTQFGFLNDCVAMRYAVGSGRLQLSAFGYHPVLQIAP